MFIKRLEIRKQGTPDTRLETDPCRLILCSTFEVLAFDTRLIQRDNTRSYRYFFIDISLEICSSKPLYWYIVSGSYLWNNVHKKIFVTVKLFDSSQEKGYLFMLGLAPPGAGKTPACHIGCARPLISHLETQIDWRILVDETSSNGLFNHFVNFQKGAAGECVTVLCIDEGYTFLSKLISTSKSASHTCLTMERMCKLYDGDYWYSVKGSKGKWVGVQSTRTSMVPLTT